MIFREPLPNIERPQMEADVVIVGGGPMKRRVLEIGNRKLETAE